MRTLLRRHAVAVLAAGGVLAGCGGGIYIGIGSSFDDPPTVSVVANVAVAAPGQAVHLAAAASDDYGIDRVQFFRVEPDGAATQLGSDGSAPYEWDTTVPAGTGTGPLRFFARAIDSAGQRTDSAMVTVAVLH